MFRYPVEKYVLRFYKFKFLGIDGVVNIEAQNRKEARYFLNIFILNNPKYHNVPIISESLSLPIFGETTKIIDNVKCVWVGNISPNGWMPLWEFEKQTNG
jgi:hypothetical protein